ncbi:MAG: hypothetical protein O9248_00280 [Rhodobacteraceae bacterium]|nr:hypothetical protein [Paracoccaceae bacterium]
MDPARPEANTSPPVTVVDIREAIGSLIILWSHVEREFQQANATLSTPSEELCASKAINLWQTLHTERATLPIQTVVAARFLSRIEEARRLRNGISHSFQGYSADPFGHGHPAELYYKSGKKTVTVPYRQVQRTITDLARASFVLGRLTWAAANVDLPGKAEVIVEIGHDLDRIAMEHPGTI